VPAASKRVIPTRCCSHPAEDDKLQLPAPRPLHNLSGDAQASQVARRKRFEPNIRSILFPGERCHFHLVLRHRAALLRNRLVTSQPKPCFIINVHQYTGPSTVNDEPIYSQPPGTIERMQARCALCGLFNVFARISHRCRIAGHGQPPLTTRGSPPRRLQQHIGFELQRERRRRRRHERRQRRQLRPSRGPRSGVRESVRERELAAGGDGRQARVRHMLRSVSLCNILRRYDLVLQTDVNTNGHTQWFFFRIDNTVAGARCVTSFPHCLFVTSCVTSFPHCLFVTSCAGTS
jgi:hypothetical protein